MLGFTSLQDVLPFALGLIVLAAGLAFTAKKKKAQKTAIAANIANRSEPQTFVPQNNQLDSNAERRNAAVIFFDVRCDGDVADSISAPNLMKLFDEQISRAAEIVLAHHGRIASIGGQSFIALWDSGEMKDDLYNGAGACLAVREDLDRLNKDRIARGHSALIVSLGLDYGAAVMTPVGTVLGPVVRFATELAMIAKGFGVDLLISDRAQQPIQEEFIFAPCSTGGLTTVYKVKGVFDEEGKSFVVRTPYSQFPPEQLPLPVTSSTEAPTQALTPATLAPVPEPVVYLATPPPPPEPIQENTITLSMPVEIADPVAEVDSSKPVRTNASNETPLAIPPSSIDIGKILSMPAPIPQPPSTPLQKYTAPKLTEETFVNLDDLNQTSFEGQWFLRNGMETLGPMTAEEIAAKLATEEVLPSWLASKDLNSGKWLAIGNTPELAHLCPKAA